MKTSLLIFLSLFFYTLSFSQINLDSGLVAHYPFDGDANDVSGNNNNPIFNNASLTSDNLGNPNSAYHFNGSNTYMRIPNNPSLNMSNQMSISLKVRPLDFYTGPCYNNMMLMKGDADFLPGTYFLRFSDILTGCTANPTTSGEQFYGAGAIATNPIVQLDRWYNVTWTYDGVIARIYVDCILRNSTDSAFSSFTSNFDLFIGKMNNSQFPYWLDGDLDDIRIYNRALNEQEITALCASGGPLPVTLTKFETAVAGKKITLNWNLENEDGILNYTVERSSTGYSDFKPLETFVAKNFHTYSFVDNTASAGQNYYYRLAILENSGSIHYSEIKAAKIVNKNSLVIVYPNPSKGNITVKMNQYRGDALFTMINSVGQIVLKKSQLITDSNPIILKSGKQSKGIYWLKVKTNNEEFIERIIIF